MRRQRRGLGQNGTYLFELEAQPGGPEGRLVTTAGSQPIGVLSRPQGVRSCSPAFWSGSSHLGQGPVSSSKPDCRENVQGQGRPRGTREAQGLWGNHTRYDGLGRLAAEYGAGSGGSGLEFLTEDHLGSVRLVTGALGNVIRRHDYRPFGQDLSGVNGRGPKYGNFENVKRFTGKERDAETGLDYFGARYMSGAQGRFTSPDLPFFDQRPHDPQSWNLYSYGRNNPLSFFDPSGRCSVKAGDSAATDDPGEPCVKQGDTSVTVSAKGGDPDEARISQFMIWTNVALNTQLREARDIGISTYAGQAIGFGVGKFVVGPVINAVATRIAAQRALAAASGAASGARAGRTWIAAYDVETGAIAVGHSGPVPNASSIHPSLAGKLDQIGGLGAENAGAVGRVGCCGEVDAANQLLQQGSKLENIRFTDAIRPRTGQVIPRCENCTAVFGSGK